MNNTVHINHDFGWFLGSFHDNQSHRHYAIQISVPIDGSITVHTADKTVESESAIVIKSNIEHRIVSDSNHFLLLVNPASSIGHFWKAITTDEIAEYQAKPISSLKEILTTQNRSEVVSKINALVHNYDCFCSASLHQGDERMDRALIYLKENINRVIRLNEIAQYCHLSPSRFLHLFKEQTGITYRRAQLWSKLITALPLLNTCTLTEAAHESGFSDAAHFSRTFRENFGFSPRDFLKVSQFIQV